MGDASHLLVYQGRECRCRPGPEGGRVESGYARQLWWPGRGTEAMTQLCTTR